MKIKYQGKGGKREIKTCVHCNEKFETLSIKVRAKGEKFCSVECYNNFRKENKVDQKEAHRMHQKKHKYGLSKDDYYKMIDTQNNKCLICSYEFSDSTRYTTACVDHDHKSGNVRGLLCHRCNKAIGLFDDSTILLSQAIKYLKGM